MNTPIENILGTIDTELLREQRCLLFAVSDKSRDAREVDKAEGLINLCDAILDAIEEY